jgi:esterase/lipase superfamily enzyme
MRRDYQSWHSPILGRRMEMLVFGHAGPPILVFPTSMGSFHEYEDRGMIGALAASSRAAACSCSACRRGR